MYSGRSRRGQARSGVSTSTGREIDIALLKGVFDKTLASESVQLVTVVGEPGLGKSRLVAELFSYVDERSGLVIWRQGRCLPYGEGITFWALSEILKAHAGILESDPPAVAARKLDLVLPDGDERAWFRQRLLPLLGVETSSVAERGELFTAWRRWLEMVAEVNPTVLVFEDLHWADDAMLAFLDHLADRAEGVPLLIVGTARPEFFDRHPNYASGLRNANTVNLAPLSEPETTRLVSALLDVSVIPVELQQPILQLAGGNPLYAEEFVRLLRDRDLLVRTGSSWQRREGVELPLPDSIRSLIAARLDTLTADEKSQLADAAVVGKVFWAGAVAAMGQRDPGDLEEALRQLSRKELIRPVRRSSMQGQAEYAFWHILTRDVAYNQLPRASRASRHVAAATWIEAQAPDRTEDLAEVLAYHYATALDLAHATGQSEEADRLVRPARRFLLLAGERALGLDTQAALTNLERALALTPPSHPDRPEVLVRFGEAAQHSGRLAEAKDALEEAIPALRASGDLATTARAMGIHGNASYYLGDPRWAELPAQACALLEPLPPSRALVNAVTEVARVEALLGSQDAAIASANRALTLAADLGLDPPPRALGYRGLARSDLGDTGGLEDMREAIRLATDAGQGREAAVIYGNLGESLAAFEGPAAALEVMRAGHALAQTRGITELVDFITPSTLDPLIACGELDEAIEVAAELAAAFGPADTLRLAITRAAQARICAMRGQAIEAAAWLEWLESTVRTAAATEYILVGLASSAMVRVALGQHDRATALLGEIDAVPNVCKTIFYSAWLPTLVRTALAVGERALAAALTTNYHPGTTYGAHALVAATAILDEARGDTPTAAASYADAARRWEQFGVIPETAYALQGYARCLIKLGRPDDATPALNRAHELLARLKATPALAETDALLEQAASLSPK